MQAKITYDPNGGFNMPTGNSQLGEFTYNSKNFEEALKYVAQKITEAQFADPSSVRTGLNVDEYNAKIEDKLRHDIAQQLGYIRKEIGRKARSGMIGNHDIGASSSAVYRRSYMNEYGGNVNISGNNRKMSSRVRPWVPGHQRTISRRTRQINNYYGLDRAFILRILEVGRDSFMATNENGLRGKGSRASWGRRGAMTARGTLQGMSSRMERAADEVGKRIIKYANNIIAN